MRLKLTRKPIVSRIEVWMENSYIGEIDEIPNDNEVITLNHKRYKVKYSFYTDRNGGKLFVIVRPQFNLHPSITVY